MKMADNMKNIYLYALRGIGDYRYNNSFTAKEEYFHKCKLKVAIDVIGRKYVSVNFGHQQVRLWDSNLWHRKYR